MALTEQRILSQITILPQQSAVNVQWEDQILRDSEVISRSYHRKAYSVDQRDAFLSEVAGAANYLVQLGWE